MQIIVNIFISLLPVFCFLVVLIFLDSFKLIKTRMAILSIVWGAGMALVCYGINNWTLERIVFDPSLYTRYISPVVEESFKSIFLVYIIISRRVGFMVDAAIYGFAIGAGFACIENIYYLQALSEANILLWVIRGFGTAIMHGGTTAIVGIISKNLSDRGKSAALSRFLPGIVIAIIIHSFFNHFLLPPIVSTVILLLALPAVLMFVFKRSEQKTREWLGVNLDADMELLNLINTGNLSDSKIGQYLLSLKTRFPAEVIVDMLCLLKLHTELSVKSKGVLMMREAGFEPLVDSEIREKFSEMKYLEKSIGRTGKMAILPFLHTSSQSLWQLYMLEQ